MRSILPEGMEDRVLVRGRCYRLRLTAARVLLAMDALKDGEMISRDRMRFFVWLLYRAPRPSGARLYEAVEAALEALKADEPYHFPSGQEPLLDLKQDAAMICAAFRQQYGLDLPSALKRMHWRMFLALLGGIGEETALGRIIAIRSASLPVRNQRNAEAVAELLRLKAAYAIRRKPAQVPGFDKGLDAMARMLMKMAKEGEQ